MPAHITTWARPAESEQDRGSAGQPGTGRSPGAGDPECSINLGLTLQKLGRLDKAVAHHENAIRLMPSYVEAHLNLGVVRQEQGRLDEAAASYEEATRLRPDYAEAHNNLGDVRRLQKRFAEAAASCERAVTLKPDYAEAHNNLGSALFELDRLPEAIASLQQALLLKPDFAMAYNNLASVFKVQGRLSEAVTCFDRALAIKPDDGECRMYRAMVWLLEGDLVRGWPEYERRPRRKVAQPPWEGEPLAGRTILLHGEQALVTRCNSSATPLWSRMRGPGRCCSRVEPLVRLLRGLPRRGQRACPGRNPAAIRRACLSAQPTTLLGTTSVDAFRAACPTSIATPSWKGGGGSVSNRCRGFRIGIVWQGNPAHKGDRRRSVSLERFVPLSRVPGVSLIVSNADSDESNYPLCRDWSIWEAR